MCDLSLKPNSFIFPNLFKNVKMLLPGHYAYIETSGRMNVKKYWEMKIEDIY